MSNLYKLKLADNLMVFQYQLDIEPDEFWEADKVMRILRLKWKQIESTIGPFVPAGRNILTLTEIDESIDWRINFRGDNVTVKIDKSTGKSIFLNDEFANKENDIKQMVFNLLINQAFRETNLK